jgi:uncharacterized protein YunC (DUF1805 family)
LIMNTTTSVTAQHRLIRTSTGEAVGAEYAWIGGQYCAIHAPGGVIGCGIYDLACADEFNLAVAIAKGTPEKPLRTPEELLNATILATTRRAAAMGITPGMTGAEALEKLMIVQDE